MGVDWHLTEADRRAGRLVNSPRESTGPVDWHLTDADKEAGRLHTEALEKEAEPLAKEHTKDELQEMARQRDLDDSGTKNEIAARIVAVENAPGE